MKNNHSRSLLKLRNSLKHIFQSKTENRDFWFFFGKFGPPGLLSDVREVQNGQKNYQKTRFFFLAIQDVLQAVSQLKTTSDVVVFHPWCRG